MMKYTRSQPMTRQPNSSHWIPPMLSIPGVIPSSRRLKSRPEREREKLMLISILKMDFSQNFINSHLKCLNVKYFPTIFNRRKEFSMEGEKLGG